MVEKWKEILDNCSSYAAYLTDFTKVFDGIVLDFLMPKLSAYAFGYN